MSAPASTFVLKLRHGIWRVSLDGAFFGDYRSESNAMDGIAEAQRNMTTVAKVVRAEEGP